MQDLTKLKTLTGIPVMEIADRLAAHFPADAYKAVAGGTGGAANLTDINTGFMLERTTEVFGLRGLGWKLEYAPDDLVILNPLEKRVTAHLKYAKFTYCLLDEKGEPFFSNVIVSGASTNDLAYAEEGARTAAIGAALKSLMFQKDIYKGLLNHNNAATGGKTQQAVAKTNGAAPKTSGAQVMPDTLTKNEFMAWCAELKVAGDEIANALKAAGIAKYDPANTAQMKNAVKSFVAKRETVAA